MVSGSIIHPLPDDAYIAKYESGWRVAFPSDVKDFLKMNGGGEPVEGAFVADGHEWAIDRFLCLLPDHRDHPLGDYDMAVVWTQLDERLGEDPDRVGAELLPIVALFAGDFVCLDYRTSHDDPSVVVWLHEQSGDLSPVTRPVSSSFTGFLDLLV
jgi:hypothetical protein